MRRLPAKSSQVTKLWALGLLYSVVVSSPAQDALRSAIQGDRTYQTRSTGAFLPPDEGLRTGPLHYSVSLGYSLEWNDNVRYTNSSPVSDFINTPQANIRVMWPVTQDSMLSFGVGVGYEFYVENGDLDRLYLSPDSELAWDIPVKDWVFTVYDRFQYSQDVISQGALSGTPEFPRMENTAGLRARWTPGRYVVQAGYAHYNFFSQGEDYDYLTRSSEQVFARAGYRFAEATETGLEVSGSLTDYDSNQTQSDNRSISFGPYVEWQVTQATTVSLRGGYVMYHYQPSLINRTERDLSSWYLGAEIQNQLTDNLRHALLLSHDIRQGVNQGSESIELSQVNYSISWAFHRNLTLSANGYYEHSEEPTSNPLVYQGEIYDRYGFGTGLRWQAERHLYAGLSYRYDDRQSDDSRRDYVVNSIILNIGYRF